MFVPYHSDAPLYHWPFATGGLIVANVFVYFLQVQTWGGLFDSPGWLPYALEYGTGLHPLQWLTSIFLHGDIFHLLGNMFFLWAFGVIVEGKVGPIVFLTIYLFTGVSQSAIEQAMFLGLDEGFSLGASSAIYGLVMISMLWAPQDTMKCVLILFFYIIPVDVPVAMIGIIYFAWDFTAAVLISGFGPSTALLHLMGAVIGIVIGLVMLLTSKVDCEQRDFISLFLQAGGGKGLQKKKSKKDLAQEESDRQQRQIELEQSIQKHWESMTHHLNAGNTSAAADLFPKIKKLDPNQSWRESLLFQIVTQWQSQNKWDQLEYYSQEYMSNEFPRKNDIAINLARILVVHRERPRRALKVLENVNAATLTQKQHQFIKKISATAQKQIAEGVIEFGDD